MSSTDTSSIGEEKENTEHRYMIKEIMGFIVNECLKRGDCGPLLATLSFLSAPAESDELGEEPHQRQDPKGDPEAHDLDPWLVEQKF